MGASWSAPDDPVESHAQLAESLRTSCLKLLSPHERRSLAWNTKRLSDPNELSAYLGIACYPAHELVALMAVKLAFNNSKRYIVVAIGLLTAKLTNEKYNALVFDALCSGEIGGEPHITFKALRDWLLIVLSAFDWDPADFTHTNIEPVESTVAERMLEPLKAPAVRYAQFSAVLETYPYLICGVANIWQRMLLDEQTTIASSPSRLSELGMSTLDIPRSDLAVLHAVVGPLKTPQLLFRCTKHGFSMKVLESNTKYWEQGGVLIVVQGGGDAHTTTRALVYVSEAYGCTLIELSPEIHVSKGIEVKIRQGQGIVAANLVVDDDLRQGKLCEQEHSTKSGEDVKADAFAVEDVQVYGFYEDPIE